jgi:protein required for attachment to host cells
MILIVVADQSRAQIYATKSLGADLNDVESLVNTSAHLKERDLVTDGPGSSMNRAGGVHQSYDPGPQARDTARRRFTQEIADSMARQAEAPECAGIVLVADSRLLSEIKDACGHAVLRRIGAQLAKNLMHVEMEDLRARLGRLRQELRSS